MTVDDALFRFRVRVFAFAEEMGSVRGACRAIGLHPSRFDRWKSQVERYGIEVLRPRERRHPRMPNATPVLVEQRIVAFALGRPGFGPARIAGSWRATSGVVCRSRPTACGGCSNDMG